MPAPHRPRRRPHPARTARRLSGAASIAGAVAITGWLAAEHAGPDTTATTATTEMAAAVVRTTVSVPNESDVVVEPTASGTATGTATASASETASVGDEAVGTATTSTTLVRAAAVAATPAAAESTSRGS